MGWVLSVTRILMMRLLFNKIDGLDDSGLSTEDAYSAMDVAVDLDWLGNEAQNVVALGLFVFCDERVFQQYINAIKYSGIIHNIIISAYKYRILCIVQRCV